MDIAVIPTVWVGHRSPIGGNHRGRFIDVDRYLRSVGGKVVGKVDAHHAITKSILAKAIGR